MSDPKPPSFRTYTQISRQNGITVPALKKILSAAGYLDGKTPTPAAHEQNVVQLRPLENDQYGTGETHYAVWNTDIVLELLKTEGVGDRKGLGIWHGHKAADRVGEAADLIAKHIPESEIDSEAYGLCCHWMFDNWWIVMVNQDNGRPKAGPIVEQELHPLLVLSYDPRFNGNADVAHARALLHAVIDWFYKAPHGTSEARFKKEIAAG